MHFVACAFWAVVEHDELWNVPRGAWGPRPGLHGAPLFERYVASLMPAALLLVGSHPGSTTTSTQDGFTFAMLVVGIFTSASIIGQASATLSALDVNAQARRARSEEMAHFLKTRGVPVDLQVKLKTFFDYSWAHGGSHNDQQLFEDTPESLQIALTLELKRPVVLNVLWLRECSPAATVALMRRLKTEFAAPKDLPIRQGQLGVCCFFVTTGTADCVFEQEARGGRVRTPRTPHATIELSGHPNHARFVRIGKLGKGDSFGIIALLERGMHPYSVAAEGFMGLERLEAEDFYMLLEQQPDLAAAVLRVAKDRLASIGQTHAFSLRRLSSYTGFDQQVTIPDPVGKRTPPNSGRRGGSGKGRKPSFFQVGRASRVTPAIDDEEDRKYAESETFFKTVAAAAHRKEDMIQISRTHRSELQRAAVLRSLPASLSLSVTPTLSDEQQQQQQAQKDE